MRRVCLVAVLVTLTFAGADVTAASTSDRNPVLGTWTATTTCSAQYNALAQFPGLRKYALEMVVGNGFIPGVRSPDQVEDPAHPCRGAIPRKHSHFFTKDGRFGSRDWTGEQVDDGTYTLRSPNTVVIAKEFPSVTFTYTVRGNRIRFAPHVPRSCSTFRCAWSLSMAMPGTTWAHVD